ncbi:MAG: dUTPase [Clostridiales bacterium]|nr:dUTPase [Clostridiales bacterium]
MDKLDDIFRLQKAFNDDLIARRKLEGITADEWIQKYMLAMLSEMAELLDEVNFKCWKDKKPVDLPAAKEELVDILHFFVSMCIKLEMTSDELHAIYVQKNRENFSRQQGGSNKPGYRSDGPQNL